MVLGSNPTPRRQTFCQFSETHMRVAFSNFSIDVNKREKVERKMGEKQNMLQPQIEYIAIKDLTISPFNVRKQVGDLTDLKGSIKSMGVLQPIIVRPIKESWK